MRCLLLTFGIFLFFSSCQRGNSNAEPVIFYAPLSTAEVVDVQVSVGFALELVGRFTPLAENERFAFSQRNIPHPTVGGTRSYTFYVVRNNDINDVTELFTFEDSDDAPQFTGDYRTAFILTYGRFADPPDPYDNPFLMIDGNIGEIRRLPEGAWVGGSLNRVSKDGRFTAFLDYRILTDTGEWTGQNSHEQVNIFVFDIKNEAMRQLVWRTNMRIEGGWSISRSGNIFLIQGRFEKGGLVALAELDPAAMKIRVLIDATDRNNRIGSPESIHQLFPHLFVSHHLFADTDENDIIDDVISQYWNPNIRLQR